MGFCFSVLLCYYFLPRPELENIDTSGKDSLLQVKQLKIDSLELYSDSLELLNKKVDTVFLTIKNDLKQQYEAVDTITNSDSLISAIKRTIHSGGITRD